MTRYGISSTDVVLLAAHDAGGANILAHLVDSLPGRLHFALSGPAVRIFGERFDEETLQAKSMISTDTYSCLIVGTSEVSDWEWGAMHRARDTGKPIYAFLDHWINYRQRFTRYGTTVSPTELWVGDHHANELARSEFPGARIRVFENPYTEWILQGVSELRGSRTAGDLRHALYVTEPAGRLARNLDDRIGFTGYTEFEALRYFLNGASRAYPHLETLTVRLHPSEDRTKYNATIAAFPGLPITISSSTLIADLAAADVVVGTHSNVLALAVNAGILATSAIPQDGIPCVLPHREIVPFRSFLGE